MSETPVERALGGCGILGMLASLLAVANLLCGCATADCGSKTVVGNHTAYPKLSSDASDLDIEVYESTEGAMVYTRKDSRVEIAYSNIYTNSLFGIWNRHGTMVLGVTIEPVEVAAEALDK